MQRLRYVIGLLLCMVASERLFAQMPATGSCVCGINDTTIKNRIHQKINSLVKSTTKDSSKIKSSKLDSTHFKSIETSIKKPLLRDNYLAYNVSYVSRLQDLYDYNDIVQQTINYKTTVAVIENIPVAVMISGRKSNTSLFRDYIDVCFDLSGDKIASVAQQHTLDQYKSSMQRNAGQLITLFSNNVQQLQSLSHDLDGYLKDSCINQYIQYREILAHKDYYTDSTNWSRSHQYDSLLDKADKYVKWFDERKQYIDSVKRTVDALENEYKLGLNDLGRTLNSGQSIGNVTELSRVVTKYSKYIKNFDTTDLYHEPSFIERFKRLSLGRSLPSGTSLSLQNISVNGLNLEYQWNKTFYTVCAGWTDFGLRDFAFQSSLKHINRFVYSAGAGIGERNKNYVLLSFFGGKKESFNTGLAADSANNQAMGLSLSAQLKTKHVLLNAEVAQSNYSMPTNAGVKNSFAVADNTNKAYSVSADASYAKIGLDMKAYYKYYGANYYGFNAYRINANNGQWGIEGTKSMFNNVLMIRAGVKRNDYRNPYVAQVYSGKNTVTTLNATFRKNSLTVTGGYMPSYQYVGIHDTMYESRYQVISAIVNYAYKIGEIPASSTVLCNRFLNNNTTQNYFYGNSTNVALTQNLFFGKYSSTFNASVIRNHIYSYTVFDGGVQYQVNSILTLKGGFKINTLSSQEYESKAGAYGGTMVNIPKVGMLSVQLDCNYYPDINYRLYSYTMGNISFTTFFK